MEILISRLKYGINRWQEHVNPADLELNPENFKNKVYVDITADKHTRKVLVQLTAQTEGINRCDRCGADFQNAIEGGCVVRFMQSESAFPGETSEDDLRTFHLGQDELDITQEVRDALLLALPLKRLCAEDCKGICTKCFANLNTETCTCVLEESPSEG